MKLFLHIIYLILGSMFFLSYTARTFEKTKVTSMHQEKQLVLDTMSKVPIATLPFLGNKIDRTISYPLPDMDSLVYLRANTGFDFNLNLNDRAKLSELKSFLYSIARRQKLSCLLY